MTRNKLTSRKKKETEKRDQSNKILFCAYTWSHLYTQHPLKGFLLNRTKGPKHKSTQRSEP